MARYNKSKTFRDKNGRQYVGRTDYPEFPLRTTDIYHVTITGDRLDLLAQRYFGDVRSWWIIAKANEISNGKLSPDPLKKLRIPTEIDDIIEAINNSN